MNPNFPIRSDAAGLRRRGASAVACSLVLSHALAAALATCVPGCASAPSSRPAGAVDGPDTIGPGAYALDVRGMSCPKCISNVDLQLSRIAGVRDLRVDMKNGIVRLRVDAGHEVAKAELARAVGDAGFTLGAVRAEGTR